MNKYLQTSLLALVLVLSLSGCSFQQTTVGTAVDGEVKASIASMIALSDRMEFIQPKEDISFQAGDWSQDQQDRILRAVMRMEEDLNQKGVHIQQSIQLVRQEKLEGKTANEEDSQDSEPANDPVQMRPKLAFQENGWLVLSNDLIEGNSEILYETLLEELFQLWLEENPERLENLAGRIGYTLAENVNLPKALESHVSQDSQWVLNTSTELNESYWLLMTKPDSKSQYFIQVRKTDTGYDLFPSMGGRIKGDEDLEDFTTKSMGQIQGSSKVVGEYIEGAYQPIDILKLNFKYLVLERKVVASACVRALELDLVQ